MRTSRVSICSKKVERQRRNPGGGSAAASSARRRFGRIAVDESEAFAFLTVGGEQREPALVAAGGAGRRLELRHALADAQALHLDFDLPHRNRRDEDGRRRAQTLQRSAELGLRGAQGDGAGDPAEGIHRSVPAVREITAVEPAAGRLDAGVRDEIGELREGSGIHDGRQCGKRAGSARGPRRRAEASIGSQHAAR
jgi:hypothetical protein